MNNGTVLQKLKAESRRQKAEGLKLKAYCKKRYEFMFHAFDFFSGIKPLYHNRTKDETF